MWKGSFAFSIIPIRGLIEDLKHFEEGFIFGELGLYQEFFSKDNKKILEVVKLF